MFLRKQSNKRQSIETLNMKMCLISRMKKSQMNHQARIKTLTMSLSIQPISGRKMLWRIPKILTLMPLRVDRKSNKELWTSLRRSLIKRVPSKCLLNLRFVSLKKSFRTRSITFGTIEETLENFTSILNLLSGCSHIRWLTSITTKFLETKAIRAETIPFKLCIEQRVFSRQIRTLRKSLSWSLSPCLIKRDFRKSSIQSR